jgi:hypothetical protein
MKTNLFQFLTASNDGAAATSRTTTFAYAISRTVALLAAMAMVSTARASDPIGIYALIDKVVLEPSETNSDKIQIWGAFAFATGSGYAYDAPKRGFVYYKLDPAKKETSLKEWADFKRVAGTKQIVGFGNRYEPKGVLHKATDKLANPDKYPLGFGIIKAHDKDYEPVRELLKLSDAKKATKDSSGTQDPAPPKRKDSSERKTSSAGPLAAAK